MPLDLHLTLQTDLDLDLDLDLDPDMPLVGPDVTGLGTSQVSMRGNVNLTSLSMHSLLH